MGKIALPAGTQWAGLNKRVDPVEITPEQSPDCANVFFYDQTLGLLGPRLGKAYAGATNYNIWGVIPYNISGQIGSLVAYGDSTSTEINLLNLYSVTTPHAGWGDITLEAPAPAIPAVINRGFYHVQALSAAAGVDTATSGAIAIAVNGATKVTCTIVSLRLTDTRLFPNVGAVDGTIIIYGTFDNGIGEVVLATMVVDETMACYGHDVVVTNVANVVDITGATLLTNITAEITPGITTSPTISGNVTVMGAAI